MFLIVIYFLMVFAMYVRIVSCLVIPTYRRKETSGLFTVTTIAVLAITYSIIAALGYYILNL